MVYLGCRFSLEGWYSMKQSKPKIVGQHYSVYNPSKVKLGLRLWTEEFIRAVHRQKGVKPSTETEQR